jgi:hypothetical protein
MFSPDLPHNAASQKQGLKLLKEALTETVDNDFGAESDNYRFEHAGDIASAIEATKGSDREKVEIIVRRSPRHSTRNLTAESSSNSNNHILQKTLPRRRRADEQAPISSCE